MLFKLPLNLLLILILILGSSHNLVAQTRLCNGLVGRVENPYAIDSDYGIEDAEVTMEGSIIITYTNEDGKFKLEDQFLYEDFKKITIRKSNFSQIDSLFQIDTALSASGQCKIKSGQIEMYPTGATYLQGLILDREGRPLDSVKVIIDGRVDIRFSNQDGIFKIPFSPGADELNELTKVKIMFIKPGYLVTEFSYPIRKSDDRFYYELHDPVSLNEKKKLKLTGRVVRKKNREPLPGVLVEIPEFNQSSTTDKDGRYEFIIPPEVFTNRNKTTIELTFDKDGYKYKSTERRAKGYLYSGLTLGDQEIKEDQVMKRKLNPWLRRGIWVGGAGVVAAIIYIIKDRLELEIPSSDIPGIR